MSTQRLLRAFLAAGFPLLAILPLPSGASLSAQGAPTSTVLPPRPFGRAVLGGTLGSAAGFGAGIGLGFALDGLIGRCNGDDPYGEGSFCAVVPAVVLGSIMGTALGVRLLPDWHGDHPDMLSTMWVATLGTLSGIFGSAILKAATDSRVGGFVGFSVGQGTLTGVWAGVRGR